jgi:hypothetical protein
MPLGCNAGCLAPSFREAHPLRARVIFILMSGRAAAAMNVCSKNVRVGAFASELNKNNPFWKNSNDHANPCRVSRIQRHCRNRLAGRKPDCKQELSPTEESPQCDASV